MGALEIEKRQNFNQTADRNGNQDSDQQQNGVLLKNLMTNPKRRHARKAARRAIRRCIPAPKSDQRLSRRCRPRPRQQRRAVPAGPQQPHRPIGGRDHRGRRLSIGAALLRAAGIFDRRACAARDRRHQRARSSGRHRQGAGMARPRQHRHHAHLRSPPHAARGQPDVQGDYRIEASGSSRSIPEAGNRQVVATGSAAKATKQTINCMRIFPPFSKKSRRHFRGGCPEVQAPPAVGASA